MLNLGVIGSGHIIPYHLRALVSRGFVPRAIGSLPESKSHFAIASSFGIERICSSAWDVLDADIDCILIATPPGSLWNYARRALERDLFTLVEKPLFSENNIEFNFDNSHKLMVGFNRRFYRGVREARNSLLGSQIEFFELDIYENPNNALVTESEKRYGVINNSVHFIDLLRYLCGQHFDLFELAFRIESHKSKNVIMVSFYQNQQYIGVIRCFFGYPGNHLLRIYSPDSIFEFCPIETLSIYKGMSVIEPNAESPVRTYSRNKVSYVTDLTFDTPFKPGFLKQAEEFKQLIDGSLALRTSATIYDAKSLVDFVFKWTVCI